MLRLLRYSGLVMALIAAIGVRGQEAKVQVTPTGVPTGSCTGSGVTIFTPAQFNSTSNWGNSTGKIGNGTNILVCGTFTGSAGASMLAFQGGGSSGNPITLTCDAGTNFTAPYWAYEPSGAIVDDGHSYVTLNGNGCTIQDTANGTGLGNLAASTAIYVANASNVIIENFLIQNFCQLGSGPTDCRTSGNWDESIVLNGVSNTTVQGNTIHDTNTAIIDNCNGSTSGNVITKNTIYNINWGIIASGNGSGTLCTGETASYNDIRDMALWDHTNPTDHHDGIFFYTNSGGAPFANASIYGNYMHGDSGSGATAFIFTQANGGPFTNLNIFNNVIIQSRTTDWNGNGLISTTAGNILNNTIFCNNVGANGAIQLNQGTGAVIENNIISSCEIAMNINSSAISTSDNAVWYHITQTGDGGGNGIAKNSTTCNSTCGTIELWKTNTGMDSNSSISNPNLTGSYSLTSGSVAVGLGANLTSLNIPALNIGAPQSFGASFSCGTGCAPRPSSGPWDSGAYEFTTSGTTGQVNAPTGLSATVQTP
jgi:hypothetical protein